VGGSPGLPYIGAEPATVGDGNAMGTGPGADLRSRRPGSFGRPIEAGSFGKGHNAAGHIGLGLGPGAGGGEEPVACRQDVITAGFPSLQTLVILRCVNRQPSGVRRSLSS
jgi:hypothetical protein